MDNASDPVGHPSLETTLASPVFGLEPDPVLDEYVKGFEAVGRDLTELIRGLNDAQLNWRPSDGHWSIAECIAHITAAGNLYLEPIDAAIHRGFDRAMLGGRDFYPGRFDRWFIAQMEPPPRRKMKSPKKIAPQGVENGAQLAADLESMHLAMIDLVRKATGLDLNRVKLRSVIIPLFRLPLGTWFAFLLAHERRHLWQARQVRQELRFPG